MLWLCRHKDGYAKDVSRYVNVAGRYRMEVSTLFRDEVRAHSPLNARKSMVRNCLNVPINPSSQTSLSTDDLELHKDQLEKQGYIERNYTVARRPVVSRSATLSLSLNPRIRLTLNKAVPERLR